jgi:asparagine synthase (glutamine-hydrolysing)
MCGITGIYAFNQIGSFYMINMAKSLDLLKHRGPDGRGTYVSDLIALGQRRLSIIDTENGRQPMHDNTDTYVIIFNGEIFNYKELKDQLIKEFNISFSTNSDTEVLLYAYIHWREGCLLRLSGFFSFSIYNKQTHELFIARDRLGVKPLLYYYDDDKFIFASELKSVLAYNIPKEIDWASVRQYFSLGYIPDPYSVFKHIKKVEAGSYIRINKNHFEEKKYYNLPEKISEKSIPDYDDAVVNVRKLIDKSIQDRLVSDVPVGAFLSGGIDSSIVVASATQYTKELNTFSIGFHNSDFFDESKHAELVAKTFDTNHTTFKLTTHDLIDHIFDCLDYLDEPFGDSSSLPLYVLSKKVASKVKVVLSGDGADELFGGYNKHRAEWLVKKYKDQLRLAGVFAPLLERFNGSRDGKWSNKIRQVNKLLKGAKLSDSDRYYLWCSIADDIQINSMLSIENKGADDFESRRKYLLRRFDKNKYDFNIVLNTDLELVLKSDMLHKVDAMSMANGLEVREPLIDYRLVDYVTNLPSSYKITSETGKRILKQAFIKELPEEIFNKPKHGFDVPLMKVFSKELKSWILDELLNEKFIKEQAVFHWPYIRQVRNLISRSENYDQFAVWSIIVFQYWWKKYMM